MNARIVAGHFVSTMHMNTCAINPAFTWAAGSDNHLRAFCLQPNSPTRRPPHTPPHYPSPHSLGQRFQRTCARFTCNSPPLPFPQLPIPTPRHFRRVSSISL